MKYLLSVLVLFFVVACGSDSDSGMDDSGNGNTDNSGGETSEPILFSLGVSDAPVDNAIEVSIEIDQITLDPVASDDEADNIVIDMFTDEQGNEIDTIQVNLLDYQGSSQLKIIDEAQEIELEAQSYELELLVVDEGSYVLLDNDEQEYDIKVPSSRLRLGEFTATADAEQNDETPAYTIEFDLRKSLVLRGNANNNNGFIIKPNGVRIVSLPGEISGTVSSDLLNLGTCTVYLYEGEATELLDVFDSDDEEFVAPETEITGSAPLATKIVADDGTYQIGFLSAADYRVALTCGIEEDDNVQLDNLTIPNAGELTPEVVDVTVIAGQSITVDFSN